MNKEPINITIVQYTGDFREAALRLAEGGGETYRAQRYSVEFVEDMAQRFKSVTTIAGFTAEAYSTMLPSGAKAVGAGFNNAWDSRKVIDLLKKTEPDAIILRATNIPLLRWIAKSRIPTLALLADSFPANNWKEKIKKFLTVKYLNHPTFEIVANHGAAATRHLLDAGVTASKLIAWDYPALATPYDRPAKTVPAGRKLIFVGSLTEAKGVGDLIRAVAALATMGKTVTIDLYGAGDKDKLAALAADLGISALVSFKGMASNDRVIGLMADADLVVVPSRHEYSEGLPLTIYEALCSRTPLIVSDHPMFAEVVRNDGACLVFPASNSKALAETIDRALSAPALYETLSTGSPAAWERVQIPTKWGAVIDDWLASMRSRSHTVK